MNQDIHFTASPDGASAMRRNPRAGARLLLTGGVMAAATSLLHVGIILGGPDWYRFFGAGERMAQQAARGSMYPTVMTAAIATMLACAALYAFSAAGLFGRMPRMRVALPLIAAVFLTRGILGIPLVIFLDTPYTQQLRARMTFMFVTSAISIVIGLCYAVGAARQRTSDVR